MNLPTLPADRPPRLLEMFQRILLPCMLAVVFIAIAVVGAILKRPAEALPVVCADPVQGCTFSHRGQAGQIRLSMPLMPLRPFTLEVRAHGVKQISAEFQMAGMDMGFNRYDLHAATPGVFRSVITLPVCVSGRRDWKLYLDVDGQAYVLPFSSL
jgi:hypothetical protein